MRAAVRARAWRLWRRAALIAAPIVAVITIAAQVAVSGTSLAEPRRVAPSAERPVTIRAAFADAQPIAAPAQGATGTIALPPEPVGLPAPLLDTGVTAARPFSTAGASATDRARAAQCLATAIYYEAASESDDGQRAVAQVVLNRARHPAFPHTVCGVVYQGSEASGCQFSFACDGAMARLPAPAAWLRAARAAAAALAGYVYAPVGLATHYHTYAVTPAWNRTLVMTDAVGAHFFHRWKGYWGTAAAFAQAYRGGEPVPGPHPRLNPALPIAPLPIPPTIALAAVLRVAPGTIATGTAETVASAVQPAHTQTGVALDTIPDSRILDRWKDSGKPLR